MSACVRSSENERLLRNIAKRILTSETESHEDERNEPHERNEKWHDDERNEPEERNEWHEKERRKERKSFF